MNEKLRILIIDDEAPMRFILEKSLTAEGFEVESAAGGDEAIELANTNHFDLILIDLVMPEMDGFETIVALHKFHPDIGIIAMSGGGWKSCSESYLRVAGKLGACRTLSKPFGRTAMLEAIEGGIGKLLPISA